MAQEHCGSLSRRTVGAIVDTLNTRVSRGYVVDGWFGSFCGLMVVWFFSGKGWSGKVEVYSTCLCRIRRCCLSPSSAGWHTFEEFKPLDSLWTVSTSASIGSGPRELMCSEQRMLLKNHIRAALRSNSRSILCTLKARCNTGEMGCSALELQIDSDSNLTLKNITIQW